MRFMAERKDQGETARAEESAREKPPGANPAGAREIGGPSGPEPTRYGDWERNGRCSDF